MSNNCDCKLDDAKMWYLAASAKKQMLAIAAELTRKRQERVEIDQRLVGATGLEKILLENNKHHLSLESAKLWDQISRFV